MIASLWLVAGQGVGRDISFNVEGTSLNLSRAHPARSRLWGDGCPTNVLSTHCGMGGAGCSGAFRLCSLWGMAAEQRSGVPSSFPLP